MTFIKVTNKLDKKNIYLAQSQNLLATKFKARKLCYIIFKMSFDF